MRFAVIDGIPYYALNRDNKPIVLPSKCALRLSGVMIYADGKDANGLPDSDIPYNARSYTITKKTVTQKSVLKLRMRLAADVQFR